MKPEELKTLRKIVANDLVAALKNEQRRAASIAKQRDKWKGIALEYKSYTARYQKELAALRTEVKALRRTM